MIANNKYQYTIHFHCVAEIYYIILLCHHISNDIKIMMFIMEENVLVTNYTSSCNDMFKVISCIMEQWYELKIHFSLQSICAMQSK